MKERFREMTIMFGAFIMIFLAEMGDKSQLMAFCLASCYRPRTILAAVFIATLINNGAAVYIGTIFAEMLNMDVIRIISGLAFLGFGAWTMLEKRNGTEPVVVKENLGSFLTLVSLFMLAEMGDKTQIASAVYAATYKEPLLTLAGVMAGMLLADALGIYLGVRMRAIVSLDKLKIGSSLVFFTLGVINLVSSDLVPVVAMLPVVLFLGLVVMIYINKQKDYKHKA